MKINCDSLKLNFEKIYNAQPAELPMLLGGDTLTGFDFARAKIASITKSCGVPSVSTVGTSGMQIFWSIVHHNDDSLIAYYYPYFEQAEKDGVLSEEKLALMIDRLLMQNNYFQIYGTQILNSRLYPIENPDSVDYRRAKIGLEPLEEYLKRFDLIE